MSNKIRMGDDEWSANLWSRIKALINGLDGRVTDVEDAGYITQETDPTVPAWAKESTKPTYTASEVGALSKTGGKVSASLGNEFTNLYASEKNCSSLTQRTTRIVYDVLDRTVASIFRYQITAEPGGKVTFEFILGKNINAASSTHIKYYVYPDDVNQRWVHGFIFEHPAQMREGLNAQEDVGLYIDAQGYVCQRISSDA